MVRMEGLEKNTVGYQRTVKIETTLYDLIDAIREEIRLGEDYLLVPVVSSLVASGRLKFQGGPAEASAVRP